MEALRSYLNSIPPGQIQDASMLEQLLAACWHEFGGDDGAMAGYKLRGRMEEVQWNPPILSFRIERHGGAAMGSTRAEIQHWELDIDQEVRSLRHVGGRQLRPMTPGLNVKPLAEEVADLIERRQEDERLKWYSDDRVRVVLAKILPAGSAVQQTLAGRRKRFWKALDERLGGRWERSGQTYTLRTSEEE